MSETALKWAAPKPFTGATKAVLLAMAFYANADGCGLVKQCELAVCAGVTERSVRAAITDLQAAGLLTADENYRREFKLHVSGEPEARSGDDDRKPAPRSASKKKAEPTSALTQTPERASGDDDQASPPLPPAPSLPPRPPLTTPPTNPPSRSAQPPPADLFGAPSPAAVDPPKPAPKVPRSRGTKPRTGIDPDFYPKPAGIVFAAEHGIAAEILPNEVQKFRDSHQGRGTLMADWDAAWRTWCQYFRGYAAKPSGSVKAKKPTGTDNVRFIADYINGSTPEVPEDHPAGMTIDLEANDYVEA